MQTRFIFLLLVNLLSKEVWGLSLELEDSSDILIAQHMDLQKQILQMEKDLMELWGHHENIATNCCCDPVVPPNPTVVTQPNGITTLESLQESCKDIQVSDANAPSGEYYLQTNAGIVFKAYCEMGLNGGGYTFLHPTALTQLTDVDVQAIFTDKKTFLMRYRVIDGKQPYAVLQQLPGYSSTDLMIGLNHNTGYTDPVNKNPQYLGNNYLYFGFLPASDAANNNQQGLTVNGQDVTFSNCDKNPNSYITLFPNFAEKTPSTYGGGFSQWGGDVCKAIEDLREHVPSSRAMPVDYFMFTEAHFGGCGCYGSTDYRSKTILATTIGFR